MPLQHLVRCLEEAELFGYSIDHHSRGIAFHVLERRGELGARLQAVSLSLKASRYSAKLRSPAAGLCSRQSVRKELAGVDGLGRLSACAAQQIRHAIPKTPLLSVVEGVAGVDQSLPGSG